MRSLYGAQFFSYMDMPWKPLEDFAELENFNPKVGNNLQYGVDFRSIYHSSNDDQEGNTFITMQGDLYFAIAPTENTLVYFDKPLYSSFEAFVLVQGLPWFGAIRAGRFVPTYGWRFVDHNAFTRSTLGFGERNIPQDGVEVGLYPMEYELSLALTNGSFTAGPTDANRGKTLYFRGAYRAKAGELNVQLGGSYRQAEWHLGRGNASPPKEQTYGGFWGAGYGRLLYLGEVDWIDSEKFNRLPVTSHTASYKVRQGWDVSVSFDRQGEYLAMNYPGLSRRYLERFRLSSEFHLTGAIELTPGVSQAKRYDGKRLTTGELMLHFWF